MKKFVIVLIIAALGLSGCEKWLDINKNPNDATTTTPYLLLPGVLTQWGSDVSSMTQVTGAWMGYWSHAGGWSGWYSEKKYEVTASYLNLFGYYSGAIADNYYIRANSGENRLYPAFTHVVDAWYYSRLVDCYGDVPYTEACQPDKTLTPAYDDDAAIYTDLISRLDTAITNFTAANAATNRSVPGTKYYWKNNAHDVVYNGDFAKWAKLANTLKLRLVMRLTNVKTAAQLKALMANTESIGYITEDVKVNPGYSASSGKTNPWWNTYGKSYDGVTTNSNTQYCLNQYFHEKLSNLSDPRLGKFFYAPSSAGGTLKSFPFGTDGDLKAQPNTTVAANYTYVYLADDWTSNAGGNGALNGSRVLTYTESLFLQAEAAQRGIITTTTAQTAYTAGVTASLTTAQVAAGAQTTYLTQTSVAWDNAQTNDQKIAKIINQKYISNYFRNHFESYCDYRRTGYPNPKDPALTVQMLSYYPGGVIRRQIPRLFPYPQADYDINKVNCQKAIDKQGVSFTTTEYPFDARVFWDTAPKTITY